MASESVQGLELGSIPTVNTASTVSAAPTIHAPELDDLPLQPDLEQWRRLAAARANALPWPLPTDESWRRTDPRSFELDSMPVHPWLPRRTELHEHPWDSFFDAVVELDGHGWGVRDRSGVVDPARLWIAPLEDALRKDPALGSSFTGLSWPEAPRERHEWTALAHATAALVVRVAAAQKFERGVFIRIRRPEGSLYCPWVLVRVEHLSALHLVLSVEGRGDARYVENLWWSVGTAGRLRLARLQFGEGAASMQYLRGRVERDASLDLVSAQLGERVVRSNLAVDLAGPGAQARLGGVALVTGQRHLDQRTFQVHSAADTASDLRFKVAVQDQGRSVYRGTVAALRGAVRISGYQRNNNLLLSPGARADSLPGLRIDADDLTCTHGATVGQIDPDELFYLRARGIPEAQARRLILEGFFEEITSRVAMPELREGLRRTLEQDLSV